MNQVSNILAISKEIQDRIAGMGNSEKAKWLENYVKHDIRSKGVGIPEIREIVKQANKDFKMTERAIPEQIALLDDLMTRDFTEDKLAAILYLQLFWKGKNEMHTLQTISSWFDRNLITDWNVCDWLCVRILTPMVDRHPREILPELMSWNESTNLWKTRASLVPFAQSKTIEQHKDIIQAFSTVLIRREERFCKTSVGWVLREYSRKDPRFVEKFLSENEAYTTREVIKNAMKYLNG